MKNAFIRAMYYRHACKLFDIDRKIRKSDIEAILEFGRLSPSSFGMEPWRFIVVQDQHIKDKLQPLCWNQPQISTCSELVIVKSLISSLAPGSNYSKSMLSRRDLPQEKIEKYLQIYDEFATDRLKEDGLFCWTSKQCYIAAANMMTGAAMMGIDSCPIEGFEKSKVHSLLDIDSAKEQIALIVAFGYRVNEPGEKIRLPLKDIVEFI